MMAKAKQTCHGCKYLGCRTFHDGAIFYTCHLSPCLIIGNEIHEPERCHNFKPQRKDK